MQPLNIHLAKVKTLLYILCSCCLAASCSKQDEWLDAKSNKSDVVPKTLQDFQGILDNFYYMNYAFPGIGLVGADNYYLTDDNYNAVSQSERNAYTWQKDIYQGEKSYDWNSGYQTIEYCNLILNGLEKITRTSGNEAAYDNVKGSALFYRAYAFYTLAQLFCKPYAAASAAADLGLPVRLTWDVNEVSVRGTVAQTYEQMVSDAKTAIDLLPVKPQFIMRPSRPSANGLLAKIYLTMEDYANAGLYANSSLEDYSTLLDYNSSIISLGAPWRFPPYPGNPEITFYAYQNGFFTVYPYSTGGLGYVSPELYQSYSDNDLRKTVLYINNGNGHVQFEGTYAGTFSNFCGIATNEILLIRAESYARQGKAAEAIADINTLLEHRYVTNTFTPLAPGTADAALVTVLQERRKELPFTGQLRWEDLRRLNKDPKFAVTLTRQVNGQTYTLPPNDPRYVYPIPDNEIQLSGIPQNER
jgi:hypothetical protein